MTRTSEAPSQTDELVAQISHYLKRRDAGYWPPARRAYASERCYILDKPKKDKISYYIQHPYLPRETICDGGAGRVQHPVSVRTWHHV